MSLLSHLVVIFFSRIFVLIPDGQILGCATIAFNDQYNVSSWNFFPFSENSRAFQSVAHQIFCSYPAFGFHFRKFCKGCSLNSYFPFFVQVCSIEAIYFLPFEYLASLHLFISSFPSSLRAGFRKVFVPCYVTLLLMHIFLGYAVTQLVEFAGSIPDGVIGIFLWSNPSGRTVALASPQTYNRSENKVSPISLGVKAVRA